MNLFLKNNIPQMCYNKCLYSLKKNMTNKKNKRVKLVRKEAPNESGGLLQSRGFSHKDNTILWRYQEFNNAVFLLETFIKDNKHEHLTFLT